MRVGGGCIDQGLTTAHLGLHPLNEHSNILGCFVAAEFKLLAHNGGSIDSITDSLHLFPLQNVVESLEDGVDTSLAIHSTILNAHQAVEVNSLSHENAYHLSNVQRFDIGSKAKQFVSLRLFLIILRLIVI